jgi:hypothetical protein
MFKIEVDRECPGMILWVEESKTLAMKPSSCLNYVVAEDCSQSCEAEEWALLLFWEVVNLQVKFKAVLGAFSKECHQKSGAPEQFPLRLREITDDVDLSRSPLKWESIPQNPFSSLLSFLVRIHSR